MGTWESNRYVKDDVTRVERVKHCKHKNSFTYGQWRLYSGVARGHDPCQSSASISTSLI